MDNGFVISVIAVIFFTILLIICNNNEKEKERNKLLFESIEKRSGTEQTNIILIELLKCEKSSNAKLNVIMWIMLIPIIINIILIFLVLTLINIII